MSKVLLTYTPYTSIYILLHPYPPFYHYITFLVEISWTRAAFPERLALAPRREVSTMREPYTDYQQYEKKTNGYGAR